MIRRFITICTAIILSGAAAFAQTDQRSAHGRPGGDAHWVTARKDGFGTANSLASKVWFTLADGILTEVYYPTLDVPNVEALQLLVVTPEGRIETEKDDTVHSVELRDEGRSLSYRQTNSAKTRRYTIVKDYVTDPSRNVLLIDISFRAWQGDSSEYKLYVYYDPSLKNSGMHDSGWSNSSALIANEQDVASALISKPAFVEVRTGYLGQSDLITQPGEGWREPYARAGDGNIIQVGRRGSADLVFGNWIRFTLALGFGKTPNEALSDASISLNKRFNTIRLQYESGWHSYVRRLPAVEQRYQKQLNVAAMVLTALEDKTHRGAMIASASIPWGGGPNANEPTVSGYHAVWPRDLYHVATAFIAIGDRAAANRALDYLFKIQQKPDGSFPQNSWVDGRPLGGGLQMDQVALSLVLAYQLERFDQSTWLRHIKRAADFIVQHGPVTDQERWEEEKGYSPSTIAAEIAGLVCAGEIARRNDDFVSAIKYLRTADHWTANIERWTATTTGPHGDGQYFIRITENDNPNDGAKIEINSSGGRYDEREIVDAGFLELVRLGIRGAKDRLIMKSLAVVDDVLRVQTSAGEGWYRYNHDAYGEGAAGGSYDGRSGRGRLWTLLTGERGQYEIARGEFTLARRRLNAMLRFANEGGMLSEQVWDRDVAGFVAGSGTGSATPLAWSMAQFIRLALSLQRGYNVETPRIVAERYLKKRSPLR